MAYTYKHRQVLGKCTTCRKGISRTHPKLPTLLPIIHPSTQNITLYGDSSSSSSKTKEIMASCVGGIASANVVLKKPTPTYGDGRPSRRSRADHARGAPGSLMWCSFLGRCHPCRSPYRPPSLKIPRRLSGYLYVLPCQSEREGEKGTVANPVYPPSFP